MDNRCAVCTIMSMFKAKKLHSVNCDADRDDNTIVRARQSDCRNFVDVY